MTPVTIWLNYTFLGSTTTDLLCHTSSSLLNTCLHNRNVHHSFLWAADTDPSSSSGCCIRVELDKAPSRRRTRPRLLPRPIPQPLPVGVHNPISAGLSSWAMIRFWIISFITNITQYVSDKSIGVPRDPKKIKIKNFLAYTNFSIYPKTIRLPKGWKNSLNRFEQKIQIAQE